MVRAPAAAILVVAGLVALAASGLAASCAVGDPRLVARKTDAGPGAAAEVATQPADSWEQATQTAGMNWTLDARRQAVTAGVEVIKREQCTRCHEIDAIPGAGRPFDCVSCHVFLRDLKPGERRYEEIAARNGRDVLQRYQHNIRHLVSVPRLSGIARRVRPEWIAGYLAAPFDVRPALDESMIRNRLAPDDIRILVRYFAAIADVDDPYAPGWQAPASPPPPDPARIAEGRERFTSWGCAACHTFGNVRFRPTAAARDYLTMANAALAPNLRFVRERLRPEIVVEWILDPTRITPGTAMPRMGLPRADAELIRDYLLHASADLAAPAPTAPLLEMPPAVARDVGWAEVKERVLGNVCVHCHMNDHEKDVGAGNIGGLGYAGTGLSLRTYEMTMRGSRGPDGKRFSVFEALPGEPWPRILQVLVARRVENQRDHLAPLADHELPGFAAGAPGMPLGLPALTDEEIGLLRRWIDQGCPGPTEATGKPGFTDGYLVPDGPVRQNQGCGVREPQEPPPTWATRPALPRPATPRGKPRAPPR